MFLSARQNDVKTACRRQPCSANERRDKRTRCPAHPGTLPAPRSTRMSGLGTLNILKNGLDNEVQISDITSDTITLRCTLEFFFIRHCIRRITSTIMSDIRTIICCNARSGAVSSRNFVCAIGRKRKGQS